MELSWRQLRQKLAKRLCTLSFPPPTSARTNADKDSQPKPAPPVGEADESALRYYSLPIPSKRAIPDDYDILVEDAG